ncbi:hypothetical protein [uncultured Megasphaera sp.]|nr:hypothetical protein [uncultured Megasphaera sp.]
MNGSFWFGGLGEKELFLSSGRLIKANDDISFPFEKAKRGAENLR